MIDQKTAFEYAQLLEEYVNAGNPIAKICACDERKQVMRFSYTIMQNPAMPITEEKIEKLILDLDDQRIKLEEQKALVVEEEQKIVTEKEKLLEVNEETDTI